MLFSYTRTEHMRLVQPHEYEKYQTNIYNVLSKKSKEWFVGSHSVHTPKWLVEETLMGIPFLDDGKTFKVVYSVEFVITLVCSYGVNSDNIIYYSDHPLKTALAKSLNVKNIVNVNSIIDTLEENMNIKTHHNVTVGNPPYNNDDSSKGRKPIYNIFFDNARSSSDYVAMVMPSRWMTGGKGLDKFRDSVFNDKHIKNIVSFKNSEEVFTGVPIAGGVQYIVWDKSYKGDCNFTEVTNGSRVSNKIDFNTSVPSTHVLTSQILDKIKAVTDINMDTMVHAQKPFGLRSNFANYVETPTAGFLKLYRMHDNVAYVDSGYVTKNLRLASKYKVLVAKAGSPDSAAAKCLADVIISEPNSICTETFLICGVYDDLSSAQNLASYIDTKFFRYLLSLKKKTQNVSREMFKYVPTVDVSQPWTPAKIYQHFSLTQQEIDHIESSVK